MIFGEHTIRRYRTADEYPSTLAAGMGAAASQAFYDSPLSQLMRTWQDGHAQGSWQSNEDGTGAEFTPAPRVDYETARQRAADAGVDVSLDPDGIAEPALALLIARQQEVRARESVMQRAPSGVLPGTAQFLAALAGSMADPLNLAASFIPVAGHLNMTRQLVQAERGATFAARTFARAQVGAVEGVVGQAAVEPLMAYRAGEEQFEYGLTDALRNIAFGAILGSAFHTTIGGLRDRFGGMKDARPSTLHDKIKALPPEVVEADFRANAAAALEGRRVDTTPIREPFSPVVERAEFKTRFEGSKVVDEAGAPLEVYHGTFKDFAKFETPDWASGAAGVEVKSNEGMFFFTSDPEVASGYATLSEAQARGLSPDSMAGGNVRPSYLDLKNPHIIDAGGKHWTEVNQKAFSDALMNGNDGIIIKNVIDNAAEQAKKPADIYVAFDNNQIIPKFTPDPRMNMDAVRAAHEASMRPESDVHADFEGLKEVDAAAAKSRSAADDPNADLKENIAEIESDLRAVHKQLGIERDPLKAFDEEVARTQQYGKALEAAALCGLRT